MNREPKLDAGRAAEKIAAMTTPVLTAREIEPLLDWAGAVEALEQGHRRPRAEIGDLIQKRGEDTLLTRSAWIEGLGMAVKSVTIFPRSDPSVQGVVMVYDDRTGALEAILDGALLTRWKTAADSLLGARLLARPDSGRLLVLGAGTVAATMIEAYRARYPGIEVAVWNRTRARAEALGVTVVDDLAVAVAEADIVCAATMATEPILCGEWLREGQHIDLIGAFRPDMREADDEALRRAEVFVDSRETTIPHIGELMIPLASGVIQEADVRGDLYDLVDGGRGRADPTSITLFKNGGGAHLDLMIARYMLDRWRKVFDDG